MNNTSKSDAASVPTLHGKRKTYHLWTAFPSKEAKQLNNFVPDMGIYGVRGGGPAVLSDMKGKRHMSAAHRFASFDGEPVHK